MEIELEVVPVYVVFTPFKAYGGGGSRRRELTLSFLFGYTYILRQPQIVFRFIRETIS